MLSRTKHLSCEPLPFLPNPAPPPPPHHLRKKKPGRAIGAITVTTVSYLLRESLRFGAQGLGGVD